MGNHGQSAGSDPSRLIEKFKKLVDPEFGNPCEEVLTTKTKKRRKEKNMSATETKKPTAATSETIAELFHEAMRRWKDLVDRFGPAVK